LKKPHSSILASLNILSIWVVHFGPIESEVGRFQVTTTPVFPASSGKNSRREEKREKESRRPRHSSSEEE
jgi:hypothetical protein